MPRLRTDDGAQAAGRLAGTTRGSTLPFQWTYVQWLVTLVAIPVGATVGGALVWLTGAGWSGPSASGCCGAVRPASGVP